MSSRVIKVGVVFEFYPDTEHAEMFTDEDGEQAAKTEEEILSTCKDLAFEDISNLVYRGELWESMSTELLYDNSVKCSTCGVSAEQEEMTEVEGLGSGIFVCEECWKTR